MKYTLSLTAAVVPLVAGHGYITSPQARVVGTEMESVCGSQIYNMQDADNGGNVQGEEQLASSGYTSACNLWLCKGYQYADNTANVHSYTTGETVDIVYDIRAPHTGYANVSIVDTATNAVIGDELIYWSVYASNSESIPTNNTNFSITIPYLGGKCTTAGECVIQHYWNAASINQTYEACIDFTVGASSGGSATASSTTALATTATAASSTEISTTVSAAAIETTTAVAVVSTTTAAAESTQTATALVTTSPTAEASGSDDGDGDGDGCEADEPTATSVGVAATSSSSAVAVPTTFIIHTSAAAAATATSSASGTVALYGQCGGENWTGSTTCAKGSCVVQNPFYSQCVEESS